MIIGLCDRFKKLPSEVLAEDVSLLRLIKIQKLGNPEHDLFGRRVKEGQCRTLSK